jgi:hypothetical protein
MQESEQQTLTIRSEADVYELLKQLEEDAIGDISRYRVCFDGWPTVKMRFVGEEFNSTITPAIMEAFLKLQKGIYQTYALAVYADKGHRLTPEEKKSLELIIKVSEGSSIFDDEKIDWNKIVNSLIQKMPSKYLLTIILTGLGLYFGKGFYDAYLLNKQTEQEQVLKQELALEDKKIINKLIERVPELAEIKSDSEATHRTILKSASEAKHFEYQDIKLSGEEAHKLSIKPRAPLKEAKDIRLDGLYRIINVNTELESGFKVKVRNEVTGIEYNAELQDDTFDKQFKHAIESGTFEKRPVELNINAKQKGIDGEIYNIVIIKAVLR